MAASSCSASGTSIASATPSSLLRAETAHLGRALSSLTGRMVGERFGGLGTARRGNDRPLVAPSIGAQAGALAAASTMRAT
jgi:hypothetical protein